MFYDFSQILIIVINKYVAFSLQANYTTERPPPVGEF
jgi:hypothetical protein